MILKLGIPTYTIPTLEVDAKKYLNWFLVIFIFIFF